LSEREREKKIHRRERVTRGRERKRELHQVIAQLDPLGFLPSVIIEEGKGETTPMEPTTISIFFFFLYFLK
jgi:hypothetical protein